MSHTTVTLPSREFGGKTLPGYSRVFSAFHEGGQKVHEEPVDLGVASFMAQ